MTRDWKTAEEWSELRAQDRRRRGFLEIEQWGSVDLAFFLRRGDVLPFSQFNKKLDGEVVAVRWDEVRPKGRKGEEIGLIHLGDFTNWRVKASDIRWAEYQAVRRLPMDEVDAIVAAAMLVQEDATATTSRVLDL